MKAHPRILVLSGRILLASLAIVVGAALSGCIAVAAGAAGAGAAIAYKLGKLETTLSADYPQVVKATQKSITKLEFTPMGERKDGVNAEFVARSALDKKVTINLTKMGDGLTKVEIRVDLIGDEALSRAVLEKIKANL